jgi:hypothetical protein
MTLRSITQSLAITLITLSLGGARSLPRNRSIASSTRGSASPIVIFHADKFWLNLHHFLYVLGRAQNQAADSTRDGVEMAPADQAQGLTGLNEQDQASWRKAVSDYAGSLSNKDLVFDKPVSSITSALAKAGDARTLDGVPVDLAIASILTRVAPMYRKQWWPKHRAANQEWQKATTALVNQYGADVQAFITKAYQLPWPATGYDVNISAYANWSGAYSTDGGLLVLSSLAPGNHGTYGLESTFHEAMHQWDSEVFEALRTEARKQNKLVPRNLSHAMIFFTAGEAVRHVVPRHVPYAIEFGLWKRAFSEFKPALDEVWKPYLDGSGAREDAFAELIRRTATQAKPPAPRVQAPGKNSRALPSPHARNLVARVIDSLGGVRMI